MGLLPQKRPQVAGYQFVDYYRAANLIGGDYYDYVKLPNDRVAVLVADVTGHGPAAALLMTKLAAEARYCLATCDHPADVVCRLNRLLCEDGVEDRFVTLNLIVLTPNTGEITIANAAHMPPLIRRRDGRIEELAPEIGGLPLGVNEDYPYQQATATILPGEIVTLYTDGISEAMNKNNEQFGFERLRKRLGGDCSDFSEYANALIDDVRRFTEKQPQSDDICVVCIRRDT
jgi:serine phosphatase RsbU (regulator of sigma subunit)